MRECKVVKVAPYMKQDGVKVTGYKYLKCMKPKAHSVKTKASPYSLLHSLHSMGSHYKNHGKNHMKKPMHHKRAMGGYYKHAMGGHMLY